MALNILVFLGSVRDSTPPKPARLGLRVALACERLIREAGHDVELIDPIDYERPAIFKPAFAYGDHNRPKQLSALQAKIEAADGYVMVSPEYNHSMSPALADMLNHFRSSSFSYKPSSIVTYSAGQWGGTRAAIGMRSFLSELGCLPVSAMIHVPKAQEALDAEGNFCENSERWAEYFGRSFGQLRWWAEACNAQREQESPLDTAPAFAMSPAQRNAP
ncbi:NADPH-dependent oxidoreductase [Aliidiomarina iranensis]|uniref:NADPH-dependent oxidoreductase n=1 Tax=Aliidiomarina iranensis TaxID=1434071 RepID=A0A432VWH5_9GAMM|nr:NAD(P)H-dependent oxidoreductase [Aliidiomarina iranensis]RUO20937.1 NADPH-dependent oxidoreductase [Aliidiomarina iranensis]